MNKKIMLALISVLMILSLVLIYFKRNTKLIIKNINPKSNDSWVGDVMPFYDGKKWQIFYLEDHRDGEIGFHPFSRLSTKDFVTYEDHGVMIPYVNQEDSQERALGTGSIIQDQNGLYHAFYTGHNGSLNPKEAIMHATSKDLRSWDKLSSDTFFASKQYESNDFRDPFVFYNEEEKLYWMLITTRKNNNGVIARYTSEDLSSWKDEGVFFENDLGTDGNLECPSLIHHNGKWYLAFSDQWPDRVTHYRISNSLDEPFTKPQSIDHWDSNAFYAGQIQQDDNNNLYVFAWIPTKEDHDDNKPYNWAGNLAVHQLIQQENGDLFAKIPQTVENFLNEKKSIEVLSSDKNKTIFKPKSETSIVRTHISYDLDSSFGFSFNTKNGEETGLNVVIEKGKISYYNDSLKYIEKSKPLSSLDIHSFDGNMDLKIILNQEHILFYINEQQVLSTRILKADGNEFTFFTQTGNAILTIY